MKNGTLTTVMSIVMTIFLILIGALAGIVRSEQTLATEERKVMDRRITVVEEAVKSGKEDRVEIKQGLRDIKLILEEVQREVRK